MTDCHCQKEMSRMKETILEKMDKKFEANTQCHADMKGKITALDKKSAVRFTELNSAITPISRISWIILTAIIIAILGGIFTVILK